LVGLISRGRAGLLGQEGRQDRKHGNTFIEIPVTVAVIGTVLAPVLAAVGAISALVARFRVVVVRAEPKPPGAGEKKSEP
jgi:hypothetical protein